MYRSKEEVLTNFDLDCVCVGYDGTQILCLPRFRDAANTKTNILLIGSHIRISLTHSDVINGGLKSVGMARVDKYRSRGTQPLFYFFHLILIKAGTLLYHRFCVQ